MENINFAFYCPLYYLLTFKDFETIDRWPVIYSLVYHKKRKNSHK